MLNKLSLWIYGVLAALLGLLTTSPAAAWGPDGHQAVGAIADQLIAGTPTGKKVRQILGSSLQSAAGWADCARGVEGHTGSWAYPKPGTYKDCALYEKPENLPALIGFVNRNASRCGGNAGHDVCRHKAYHFTDVAVGHDHYDPALPGTGKTDVVHAMAAVIVVLQGQKSPPPFSITSQREAIRLLTHYIGDLHQPLHVGAIYLDDAGHSLDPATEQDARAHGTAGGMKINFEGAKLHEAWDRIPGSLLKLATGDTGKTEARAVAASPGTPDQWPAAWASETLGKAGQAFKGLSLGPKAVIGSTTAWPASAAEPDYRRAREALQHAQIVKAGARLAALLTRLLP